MLPSLCLFINISLLASIIYSLHCFCIMETSELLLTILCGFLIAYITANYQWNKAQPRRVSAVSITTGSTTVASVITAPKKPFVVRISGIPLNDESQSKSWIKTTITELSNNGSNYIKDITIVRSCTDTDNLVALVDFEVPPDFLSSLKSVSRKVLKAQGQDGSYNLEFSAEFLGFTQMYSLATKPTAE